MGGKFRWFVSFHNHSIPLTSVSEFKQTRFIKAPAMLAALLGPRRFSAAMLHRGDAIIFTVFRH